MVFEKFSFFECWARLQRLPTVFPLLLIFWLTFCVVLEEKTVLLLLIVSSSAMALLSTYVFIYIRSIEEWWSCAEGTCRLNEIPFGHEVLKRNTMLSGNDIVDFGYLNGELFSMQRSVWERWGQLRNELVVTMNSRRQRQWG